MYTCMMRMIPICTLPVTRLITGVFTKFNVCNACKPRSGVYMYTVHIHMLPHSQVVSSYVQIHGRRSNVHVIVHVGLGPGIDTSTCVYICTYQHTHVHVRAILLSRAACT